jgi:5-(carboxyamino)imidazole ribonucleotide synthase
VSATRRLKPGDTIGILGGGQLARMLAIAAAPLGLRCQIYAPAGDNPAFDVAAARTIAAYDDAGALARFGQTVDLITYEFENVPDATVALLASSGAPVRPGVMALRISQDRALEKAFLAEHGVAVAPWTPIDDVAALTAALADPVFARAILKTRRFGYDGKGQLRLRAGENATHAFAAIGRAPAVLEAMVDFRTEISIVAARGLDGAFAAFDATENRHDGGILARSTAPAAVTPRTAEAAAGIARRIAEAFQYVGVLAVEFFVVGEGADERLLVNEIAPRVHNSGHWTIEGAETSQFAQAIRAIAGWPLGPTGRRAATVTMDNLIGDAIAAWPAIVVEPGAHLHHYGKAEARPGRKMGHVTRLKA